MDNQNHVNENEQLELEEQAIGEPKSDAEVYITSLFKPSHEMSNEEQDHYAAVE